MSIRIEDAKSFERKNMDLAVEDKKNTYKGRVEEKAHKYSFIS